MMRYDVPPPTAPDDFDEWESWAESAIAGAASDELIAGVADDLYRDDWLDGLAEWAERHGPPLALARLRAGLKLGGMAPGMAVAIVAEIRRRVRERDRIDREHRRLNPAPLRPLPETGRAAAVIAALRARPDAARLVERDGFVYVPTDMARAAFVAVGVDSAELARWRDCGILRASGGTFTTKIRLGPYARPRVYALRADVARGRSRTSGPLDRLPEAEAIAQLRRSLGPDPPPL